MSAWGFLYRNLLWFGPPLMLMGALLLGLCIRGEVRLVKESKIVSLPLLAQQEVTLPNEGEVVLSVEGPRFSSRFQGLKYALLTAGGMPVEGRAVWLQARTTGVSWARVETRVFTIPQPGRYILQVEGLGMAREGDDRHHLVFTRPHLAPAVGYVLGMILSFGLFVVSLVFFVLRLTGVDVGVE